MLPRPKLRGRTFFCNEAISLAAVSQDLCRICTFLQNDQPYIELRRISDWQQHDGLRFDKGTLTFHELFQIVGTPRSLFEAVEQDDSVCTAIEPINQKWYLRFRVNWDENDEYIEGKYDITFADRTHSVFAQEVVPNLLASLQEVDATIYFQELMS